MGSTKAIASHYVGALFYDGARILLGLRAPSKTFGGGTWDLIGGHVEQGETEIEALRREVREELGVNVVKWKYAKRLQGVHGADATPFDLMVYVVTQWDGTIRNHGTEHTSVKWFFINDLHQGMGLVDDALPGLIRRFVSCDDLPSQ